MIENFWKSLDNNGLCTALTDLSKACFDLPNDLLIPNFHNYGWDFFTLNLLQNYLNSKILGFKTNTNYRSWTEVLFVVTRSSLGSVCFSIFFSDI